MAQDIKIPWMEKYRPHTLNDVILSNEIKEKFLEFIQTKQIPHLLFVGKPGTGKTTCARILASHISEDILFINASKERGIDVLRDQISDFCLSVGNSAIKIVILDEFDNITFDAVNALRGLMEEAISNCRFILTGNYKNRITEAIQSRCQYFEFEYPDKKKIAERCYYILKSEGVVAKNFASDIKIIINRHYPDIRIIIGSLEKYTKNGIFSVTSGDEDIQHIGDQLIEYIKMKDWRTIRKKICSSEKIEFLYRYMFDNVDKITTEKQEIVLILIAEGMKDHFSVLDPEINFISTILKIMQEI